MDRTTIWIVDLMVMIAACLKLIGDTPLIQLTAKEMIVIGKFFKLKNEFTTQNLITNAFSTVDIQILCILGRRHQQQFRQQRLQQQQRSRQQHPYQQTHLSK